MCDDWRIRGGAFVLFLAGAALLPTLSQADWAISAEVTKKCQMLRDKQFPPGQRGNPAATHERRAFFSRCVSNGGNMDSKPQQN
jgi:hypothetical protein